MCLFYYVLSTCVVYVIDRVPVCSSLSPRIGSQGITLSADLSNGWPQDPFNPSRGSPTFIVKEGQSVRIEGEHKDGWVFPNYNSTVTALPRRPLPPEKLAPA